MRPDIVLLDSHWPRRALLRAQLIEEGYEVIATDEWPTAKSYVQGLVKPRLVIVDLQDLPDANGVLDELQIHMGSQRILVLTALGTSAPAELEKRGFRALARPATISDIIRKTIELFSTGDHRPLTSDH